jgi:predicted TIM-barrel fold metal-dependent hydrolase
MFSDLGRVIDVHNHWIPVELLDSIERCLPENYRCVRAGDVIRVIDEFGIDVLTMDRSAYSDVTQRLLNMDIAGIDVALLSASCYPAWITLEAARIYNDAGAELMRSHGGRLRPMVHVPPFGADGILDELERAANMGLTGVAITTNFRGRYPDEEEYLPFLRKAADLGLPVFIHAAGSPVHAEDLHKYNLTRTLGRALDHTLVAVRMLHSGIMAGLPDLKLVFNHLGGTLFATPKRYLDLIPDAPLPPGGYRKLLEHALFDTAPGFLWSELEIEFAVRSLGVERIALGTDYPAFPMGGDPGVLCAAMDNIQNTPFSLAEKRLIAGGNAERFYRLSS